MENQLFVAMSPLFGSDGLPSDAPIHTVGTTFVAGPIDKNVGKNDGLIAAAEDDGERLLIVELDRAVLERSRTKPEAPGLALRRLDLYEKLRADTD